MEAIFNEVKLKISIDEENVSLNALELFTRGETNGLKNAMKDLINECV